MGINLQSAFLSCFAEHKEHLDLQIRLRACRGIMAAAANKILGQELAIVRYSQCIDLGNDRPSEDQRL